MSSSVTDPITSRLGILMVLKVPKGKRVAKTRLPVRRIATPKFGIFGIFGSILRKFRCIFEELTDSSELTKKCIFRYIRCIWYIRYIRCIRMYSSNILLYSSLYFVYFVSESRLKRETGYSEHNIHSVV